MPQEAARRRPEPVWDAIEKALSGSAWMGIGEWSEVGKGLGEGTTREVQHRVWQGAAMLPELLEVGRAVGRVQM